MRRNKQKFSENYLERIPLRAPHLRWSKDEAGLVTLEIDNKGLFNKIAQTLFKKPKVSFVHLDEMGSLIWPLLDGDKSILALGEYVKEAFGEKAEPLYPRLAKYFQILDSYRFVEWKKDK